MTVVSAIATNNWTPFSLFPSLYKELSIILNLASVLKQNFYYITQLPTNSKDLNIQKNKAPTQVVEKQTQSILDGKCDNSLLFKPHHPPKVAVMFQISKIFNLFILT